MPTTPVLDLVQSQVMITPTSPNPIANHASVQFVGTGLLGIP